MKKSLAIFFFLAVCTSVFSFPYDQYEPTTIQNIIDNALPYIEGNHITSFKNTRYKVQTLIDEFPVPITVKNKESAVAFLKLNGYPKESYELFSYELKITVSNVNVFLLFQSPLIPYLKDEVALHDAVTLYIVFGFYDEKTKSFYVLVNEFQTDE